MSRMPDFWVQEGYTRETLSPVHVNRSCYRRMVARLEKSDCDADVISATAKACALHVIDLWQCTDGARRWLEGKTERMTHEEFEEADRALDGQCGEPSYYDQCQAFNAWYGAWYRYHTIDTDAHRRGAALLDIIDACEAVRADRHRLAVLFLIMRRYLRGRVACETVKESRDRLYPGRCSDVEQENDED